MAKGKSTPPGRLKICNALRLLLEDKDFSSITISEIATTAEVTEALIYKYFHDKRDLLYDVLTEYLVEDYSRMEENLDGVNGAYNKLKKFILYATDTWTTERVFARILLFEISSFSNYYKSRPYYMIKKYDNKLMEIITKGVETGEFRSDLSPAFMRLMITGSLVYIWQREWHQKKKTPLDKLVPDCLEYIMDGIGKG